MITPESQTGFEGPEIRSAEFVKSSADLHGLPAAEYPEYAFVGRSNVGKSSLINSLVQRKNLARTSSTPGKTQLINHFLINEEWALVDLPGYGYAKVSKTVRSGFQSMILDYVLKRESLMNVFVLVDSRLKPQAIDLEFIEFLGVERVPFTIVFTKTDKPNQKELSQNFKLWNTILKKTWQTLPPIIKTSAVKGKGREELLAYIEKINPSFKKP